MTNAAPEIHTYESFVTNNDVRIHFRAAGEGPLLVLLHGFPDNSAAFEQQIVEFSKEYRVVCPTLRGYPPSDIPENVDAYDLTLIVSDILKILDHFHVQRAIVGGHDFGGAAIQMLALLHPERVTGLIIMNSPIVPNFYDLANFDQEQQKLSEYTIRYHQYQPGDDKNEEFVVRNIRDPTRRQAVRDYLTSSPIHGMLSYYKKNYPAPPYGNSVDTCMMLYTVPTLIIWGLEEEYFSLRILDNLPQLFLNTIRLVTVPGAGHWSFRDKPAKVNREIWSWLRELKSRNDEN